MIMRKLRWFSLASLLGLLAIPLQQHSLYALFGLAVFTPFFWFDERSKTNAGRAAECAFVFTLIAFVLSLLYLGALLASPEVTQTDVLRMLGMAFGAIYGLHLASFAGSYIYFEVKGV